MKMKLSLLICIAPVLAQAEVVSVKSNLWSAPFENKLSVRLEANDSGLAKICGDYQSLLIGSDGTVNNPYPSFLSDIRSQPDGATTSSKFQTMFKIKLDSAFRETIDSHSGNDLFSVDFANLRSSLARVQTDTLTMGTFNLDHSKYMAISEKEGLSRGSFRLMQNGREVLLQVNTKDVACDLLSGNVSFGLNAISAVIPQSSDQRKLDAFYETVQNQVLDALNKDGSDQQKAIRIGYRLGGVISPSSGFNAETEKSVLGLFKVLFDENSFTKSNAWSTLDGFKLVVSGSHAEAKTYIDVSI